MMNDIKNVWVLLTKNKAGDRVYTRGVYLAYEALKAAIEEIEVWIPIVRFIIMIKFPLIDNFKKF